MRTHLSTADMQGNRLDFWQSWCTGELHAVEIKDCEPDKLWVECEIVGSEDIGLVKFRGARQTFHRPQSMVRSYNSDDFLVSVIENESSLFEQNGYSVNCRAGDVTLIDTARPYLIAHQTDARVTSMLIPRDRLRAVLAPADTACGLVLDGQGTLARLIRGYVGELASSLESLEADTARGLCSIAVDLVAAGFSERLNSAGSERRQGETLGRARAAIDEMLHRVDLDAEMIAGVLRISRRRLYEIFQGEDLTVTDLIWERRLVRAAQLLASDPSGKASAATVAFRTGFSSPAHFSRRFKERFQMTPGEYRVVRALKST